MGFESDLKKSGDNKKKHGIDFYEAQLLWEDPDLIEVPVKTSDEPRAMVIGKLFQKYSRLKCPTHFLAPCQRRMG
ncbi:MAG: BrnT family toxin [Deltaproteobacteria bacterium]|nr:BrnT family toxin [Deltaproteobacteria bacterium]